MSIMLLLLLLRWRWSFVVACYVVIAFLDSFSDYSEPLNITSPMQLLILVTRNDSTSPWDRLEDTTSSYWVTSIKYLQSLHPLRYQYHYRERTSTHTKHGPCFGILTQMLSTTSLNSPYKNEWRIPGIQRSWRNVDTENYQTNHIISCSGYLQSMQDHGIRMGH